MMNRYLIFIFLIIPSLLTGCMGEREAVSTIPTKAEKFTNPVKSTGGYTIKNASPIQFKVGEQEFQIVPVFESILEYIQKVKQNPKANYKELYISTVVEPFRKMAFGADSGLGLKDQYSFAAPTNIDKLNESIILLDENYEHICSLIKEGLEKSAELLPSGEKKTVYLFPINPDQYRLISQMSGVNAFSTPGQFIIMQVAPQNYKEEMVPYTIAHEYQHTVYFEKINTQERDLIDYALVEGKADTFANLVFPAIIPPWTAELSHEEEQNLWNWTSERRYSYNDNDLYEMRSGMGGIPQWSDYKIGYQIMQDFLKSNPDVPINVWTYMSADEILEKSHFAEKFH